MRKMLVALTLALTLAAPAFAAPGRAPTKQQLKTLKVEAREAKKIHRQVDRYARKWNRAVQKGKRNKIARFDGKLADVYKAELQRIRRAGVSLRPEPPPRQHPAHPRPPTPPEHPKLEAHRDDLQILRDGQRVRAQGKARVSPREKRALRDVQRTLEQRATRKARQFQAAKHARG